VSRQGGSSRYIILSRSHIALVDLLPVIPLRGGVYGPFSEGNPVGLKGGQPGLPCMH
jgi:hypothetical protein